MQANSGIAAVVVLYQKAIKESATYLSFLQTFNGPVLVYDNSPDAQSMDHVNWEYIHNPNNPGVSVAYNYAMRWAIQKGMSHLILLDSDSSFPTNALNEYVEGKAAHASQLILPNMQSAGRKISPFYFKWGKSWYGDSIVEGIIELGKVVAINSGMMIPIGSMNQVGGFNEDLALDWSDIDFIRRLAKQGMKGLHIPLNVSHDLSEHETQQLETAQFRYRHYLGGIKIVSANFWERLMMLFWAKMKALKLCLKYGTAWFLIYYIRNFHA